MTAWRCSFYERTAVAGRFRYDQVVIPGPGLTFDHPPAVGDLIHLHGAGSFRVVERSIIPSQYGSMDWPHGPTPQRGPIVDFIVERASGPFVDEVIDDRESSDGSQESDA